MMLVFVVCIVAFYVFMAVDIFASLTKEPRELSSTEMLLVAFICTFWVPCVLAVVVLQWVSGNDEA